MINSIVNFIINAASILVCIFLGIFIGVVINATASQWPEWAPAIYICYGLVVGKFVWTK
ncbi:hypothetical protein MYO4S_00177 [Serratia phage 4S]|nr:hypothetical protein MYO4S_00177 [Serratia phage 4S]